MSVMTIGKGLTAAESNAYARGVAAGKRDREDALTTIIKELEAERDALKALNTELVEALKRFANLDTNVPSGTWAVDASYCERARAVLAKVSK